MITMSRLSSKLTAQNLDTHTKVNRLDLDAFNYNRFTWWLHTHKANIIFLILLTIMVLIAVYVGDKMNSNQCASDKAELTIWFGVATGITIFTYLCVWPHTQWRSLSPQSSKFLGVTAIARQQTHLSHQTLMETPEQQQTAQPEPPMAQPIVQPMAQPIVQSMVTPIPQPEPVAKVEESEATRWLLNLIYNAFDPDRMIPGPSQNDPSID